MRGFDQRYSTRAALAIGVALLISAGASAHAGLSVIAASIGDSHVVPQPAADDGLDHFPGSAYFYAIDDNAAPAPGVTGTAPLPALPAFAETGFAGGDGSVVAARPFALRGGALDRARAVECLTAAIYYEAASESDNGQRAVAQVVLNRVRHQAFPNSVCGVVYQGSERQTGCQFSFSCDGAMARTPSTAGWARARRHAAAALSGQVFAPAGLATHYHTFAVKPVWNKSLVMTTAIGAHFFHRWKGFWGTPAGFTQAHAGAEPWPGPRPRAASALAALTAGISPAPMPLPSPDPRAPAAPVQPAYARSGDALPGGPADVSPESQVREQYRDSGTWIAR